MGNINGDDDAAAMTSDADNNPHALPCPIRTGVSNNHQEHFPLRQEENNVEDEVLVDTEIYHQGPTRIACFYILLPLMLFVSLGCFLFRDVSEAKRFQLRPHESIILDESPNPLFRQYLKVERIYPREPTMSIMDFFDDETDTPPLNITSNWSSNPMLFGFERTPPLNIIITNWSEYYNTTLDGHASKEDWIYYYLNKGSEIDITYKVTSLVPPHVYLVIREEFSSQNNHLLGVGINGTGEIAEVDIQKSSKYIVSVYNRRHDTVQVELQLRIKGVSCDKKAAFYKCHIDQGACFLRIPFKGANIALLGFPDPNVGNGDDVDVADLFVSYETRWITWLVIFGGELAIFAAVEFLTRPTTAEGSIPLEDFTRQTVDGRSSSQENAEGYILLDQESDIN